ncbi:uncharacterized protein LY89DRAFT_781475 [Mollisia scopiformis]|uniref:CHRD domain-containing protein n=1 Tax=Mollisia scopiformis TaxID=149040 RepID=A0A194XE47_MOLSC|nr:uncharacterized protein LY89DRAFT_781475 [Mollisia scopiformis]KUJ18421.1 hypothetical protein LY89DRAFT_781475 [Mollisia scopiformis]
MRTVFLTTAILATTILATTILATTILAAPTDINYGPPPGGWGSIDYPKGTGENLPYYPPPPGGWEAVKYPPGTGSDSSCASPFKFTSTYHVVALGSEVRNGTTPAPGPKDAVGFFDFGINAETDTICYNITLLNVSGTPQSPAKTATHIHAASRGASGPPRLAFPNPVGDDKRRSSIGCMTGPFTTGLNGADGKDTATGFRVEMIEANPARYFTDFHSNLFTLGVVRGQLA